MGLLGGSNEITQVKHLAQCLIGGKHLINISYY